MGNRQAKSPADATSVPPPSENGSTQLENQIKDETNTSEALKPKDIGVSPSQADDRENPSNDKENQSMDGMNVDPKGELKGEPKTSSPAKDVVMSDRYAAIHDLDQQDGEDEWSERTAIITRMDHERYEQYARDVVYEIVGNVRTPVKKGGGDSSRRQEGPEDERRQQIPASTEEASETFTVSESSIQSLSTMAQFRINGRTSSDLDTSKTNSSNDSDSDEFASAEQSFSSIGASSMVTASTSLENLTAALASEAAMDDPLESLFDAMAGLKLQTSTPAGSANQSEETEVMTGDDREPTPVNMDADSTMASVEDNDVTVMAAATPAKRGSTTTTEEDVGDTCGEGSATPVLSSSPDKHDVAVDEGPAVLHPAVLQEQSSNPALGEEGDPAVNEKNSSKFDAKAEDTTSTTADESFVMDPAVNAASSLTPELQVEQSTVLNPSVPEDMSPFKPTRTTVSHVEMTVSNSASNGICGDLVQFSPFVPQEKRERRTVESSSVPAEDSSSKAATTPVKKDSTPEFEEEEKRVEEEEAELSRSSLAEKRDSRNSPSNDPCDDADETLTLDDATTSVLVSGGDAVALGDDAMVEVDAKSLTPSLPAPNDDFSPHGSVLPEPPLNQSLPLEVLRRESVVVRTELLWQERLLEKDREMAEKEKDLRNIERELMALELEKAALEQSNKQMTLVVEEYEKTISEVIGERERARVVHEIEREKIAGERAQAVDDLNSAEAAFNDVNRKLERTKEVIAGFQENEDKLKVTLQSWTTKAQKAEERYNVLKTHAEGKLNDANSELETLHRKGQSESARLEAMLRKAEMKVASLETQFQQKQEEGRELTQICDELIAKVGGDGDSARGQ